ncbi:MAG: hypothetical protein GXO67_05615 [Archaeoglobi archaeon]|nr:hypothetical protein [Archaeoglobi archaeon]
MVNLVISQMIKDIEKYGCRTVIFYENIYPAIAFFKKIMEGRENVNLLLFSNNSYRQLKMLSNLSDIDLSKTKTILLNRDGKGDADVVFSYNQTNELYEYLSKLEGTLVVLGRSHLKIVSDEYIAILFDILESLNNGTQVYAFTNYKSYTEREVAMISSLFDVAIVLKKQEEYFGFGEEIYEFHIIQSIIPEIKPGMDYFKVSEEMKVIGRHNG